MKKLLAMLLILCMVSGLLAASAGAAFAEDEENHNTGDASLDDPLNADGIGEKELLVVSFGTSFNDSRRLTIGAIETALQDAYPDWSVRRASQVRSSSTMWRSATGRSSTTCMTRWSARSKTASRFWPCSRPI